MSRIDEPTRRASGRGVAVDWDERVDSWEAVASSPAFLRLAAEVVERAAPRATDRVVDLGAGTGLLSLALAAKVDHVVAVDTSEAMLARLDANRAELALSNVSTCVADLRALPLPDESASVVVSNYAFHHVDDAGKELALTEARRVLVPGGRLVVCDMMFALSLGARDRALLASKVVTIARRGPSGLLRIAKNAARVAARRWEHPCRADAWEAMLARRGFSNVDVRLFENEAGLAYAERPQRLAPASPPPALRDAVAE